MLDSVEICPICHEHVEERMTLPCQHVFCRACVDALFVRHATAGDYASRCPMCRAPLMGRADAHFGDGMDLLTSFEHGVDPECLEAAITEFEACIAAVQHYATGPGGLNRLAAAAQYNIGRCYQVRQQPL